MLGVAALDADVGAQHLAGVGLQVAVGVLGENQLRRRDHQHAAVEHFDGARHDEAVEEHGALVDLAVIVGVLEHRDVGDGRVLPLACEIRHEPAHLDHPQAAVGVHVEPDGIDHERLARDELEAVTRREAERASRGLGRERRRHGVGRSHDRGRRRGCLGRGRGAGSEEARANPCREAESDPQSSRLAPTSHRTSSVPPTPVTAARVRRRGAPSAANSRRTLKRAARDRA